MSLRILLISAFYELKNIIYVIRLDAERKYDAHNVAFVILIVFKLHIPASLFLTGRLSRYATNHNIPVFLNK